MNKEVTKFSPKPIFWIFQFVGWGILLFLGIIGELISTQTLSFKTAVSSSLIFIGSILITSLFRLIILRKNLLRKSFSKMVLHFLGWSGILAIGFYLYIILGLIVFSLAVDFSIPEILSQILSNFIIFFMWAIAYSTYFFIQNSRKQELNNLRLLSVQKDMELNVLKNQLNPHFMFNALNSIRALIDEDPIIAKKSITQLSNVLRNTLVLGQEQFITVEDELKIVSDYLQLEKVRFEERLNIHKDISGDALRIMIPPLLIQTFVENAIKHGISQLAKGGTVSITINNSNKFLNIEIANDGFYDPHKKSDTGIGLTNIKKRLDLIYPEHFLGISNTDGLVVASIKIPLNSNSK
ncbi:MAG: histidine kinase [Flavobacteriales bacterium]|jgi:sensor histidine kinase YesM|nr:histidine kinase [Flavobacteriales bacterium]